MRRTDTVAGRTGVGRRAAREILAMANLAGHQAPAGRRIGGHLGANTMEGWIGEPGDGLMMAAGRQAGRHTAADLENGDLMTFGAGVDSSHGLPAMGVDPTRRMVVPVVLGHAGSLATSTADENKDREQCTSQNANVSQQATPVPDPVHGDTRGRQATREEGRWRWRKEQQNPLLMRRHRSLSDNWKRPQSIGNDPQKPSELGAVQ